MNNCDVYFSEDDKRYEGQYEICERGIELEVFHYYSSKEDRVSVGEYVKFKKIQIVDLRNKVFVWSPTFVNAGVSFGLTQYEKFNTNFYFRTNSIESVECLGVELKVKALKIYNPMLVQCFGQNSMAISQTEEETNYKIIRNASTHKIEINQNNVSYIEFGNAVQWLNKHNYQSVSIESENYAKIEFAETIECDDILQYVKEFDVYVDAYCLTGCRSYKTFAITAEGQTYEVVHKLLGGEKYYDKRIYNVIKMSFFEYIEKMYKSISYRTANNRNEYILLEFKKPTSLEDQYTFYYRYIDMYMGDFLQKNGKKASNYDRISRFVDDNIQIFNGDGNINLEDLKKELNSLRNHYVHEGYYLPNGKFAVTEKRKVLYHKVLDYAWLHMMVTKFKYSAYKTLYTEVLEMDINAGELKNALKCWF